MRVGDLDLNLGLVSLSNATSFFSCYISTDDPFFQYTVKKKKKQENWIFLRNQLVVKEEYGE